MAFSKTVRSSLSTLIIVGVVPAALALDLAAKTNVGTYWGQGPNQQRLLTTCQNASVDVVNLAFVNQFPDQTGNGYPGDNFGNACWGDVYTNSSGASTSLLKTCPNVASDVKACQQTYGKKIMLSIGGGYPTNYYLKSNASGVAFGDFLWQAWGPVNSSYTGPRPLDDAVVDGFDFDIESEISPAPSDAPNYQTNGYVAMINHLRNDLFVQDVSKTYYISGSPQCVLPDTHFTNVVSSAWFDFLHIQFYNTPQCSARAGIAKQNGNDISYSAWTTQASLNKNVRMYIGLPAAPAAANDDSYFLNVIELQSTIQRFYDNSLFGGIMLWESTYALGNVICGQDYTAWTKNILNGQAAGPAYTVACSSTSTASGTLVTTTSSTSSTVSTSSIVSTTASSTALSTQPSSSQSTKSLTISSQTSSASTSKSATNSLVTTSPSTIRKSSDTSKATSPTSAKSTSAATTSKSSSSSAKSASTATSKISSTTTSKTTAKPSSTSASRTATTSKIRRRSRRWHTDG